MTKNNVIKVECVVEKNTRGKSHIGYIVILFAISILFSILIFSSSVASTNTPDLTFTEIQNLSSPNAQISNPIIMRMQKSAIRKAAAARIKAAGVVSTLAPAPDAGGLPHYFGPYPNYANSPAPTVDASGNITGGGIRKFVDSLPGLNVAGANNLGQYIPVAIPDTTTYPGSDYYEIELGKYTEKMHTDLPPTTLLGYRQTNTVDTNVSQFHSLGPIIISTRDRAVRIKFTNNLSTGAGGDLFLPVDTTIMGAGPFTMDDPLNPGSTISGNYTQNRASIHLHGGYNIWISDGTPHQWFTPAGESTPAPKGVSFANVPDMWYDASGNTVSAGTPGATNDPGNGSMTFYYSNQQSARLQFYHDHAFGITRLNVYAGEAAGYLITDQVEKDMMSGTNVSGVNPNLLTVLPGIGIPLIIQDKSYVDNTTIGWQDPTWNSGTGARYPNGTIQSAITGDLWLPHVYMTNENPSVPGGANAFGRWDFSVWADPALNDIAKMPIPNPYCLPTPGVNCSLSVWPLEGTEIPDIPNPSYAPETFMDTPVINGVAYPNLTVDPKAYRFRILNAANDRFVNLQMYVADPNVTTQDGRINTEVKMVPANATAGFPASWPTDARVGGVPDPATRGPSFIQIGTEGGFLPAPVVLPNQPTTWNLNASSVEMGLVNNGTLILAVAERADVIVDFSQYAGKTIILYNDAPAPYPSIDDRYDYYTGNPNLTSTGGAPSTLAGYGPNTRTIMQIKVNNVTPAAPYNLSALQAVFAKTAGKNGVFEVSQDEIIVSQKGYESAYNKTYLNQYINLNDTYKSFTTALGTPMNITFEQKGIDDMGTYSVEDGRMSAMLGVTTSTGYVAFPFMSPPVDIIKDSVSGTQIGSMGDGTQLWKFTHNGVDTHPIHVHLFNAQLINRIAHDGTIRAPDPNELGWKETFRLSPSQDAIVALRAVAPTQPFKIPNSIRVLDPTMPLGAPLTPPPNGWRDTQGNNITVFNHMVNFGWEYMYHCHILGHEEMDMMHAVSFAVIPDAPVNLSVSSASVLTWTDNSSDETNWTINRQSGTGPWTIIATIPSSTGPEYNIPVSYTDTTGIGIVYNYSVIASNVVGDTVAYAVDISFPRITTDSAPSNIAQTNSVGLSNVIVTMPQATSTYYTTSLVVDAHVNKVVNWMGYSLNAAANVSMTPHNIWNFDEGTGTSVADFGGNNNNLALLSPYTWVSGKSGNALDINRNGAVVEKSIAPFDPNTATISFWFKARPGMTAGTLFSTASNTSTLVTNDQINIGMINSKVFARVSTGGTNQFTLYSPDNLNDGSWHHLAFVLNNTDTTTARLYIDGADVANTASVYTMTNQVELRLSCGEALGHGCKWNGAIDELRIYDTPLGITAIVGSNAVTVYANDTAGNMNSSTNNFMVYSPKVSVTMPAGSYNTNSLVVDASVNKVINWMGYSLNSAANVSMAPHNIWNFDEGAGTNVADFSGNNNNLALLSPYTWVSGKSGNAIGINRHGAVVEKSITPFDSNTATIAFWFKARPGMTAGTLFSTASNTSTLATNDQINIGMINSKVFARVSTGGINQFTLQSLANLNDDNWHHLAFVLNNTDATTARLYIDGADVANTASAFNMTNQVELRLSCGEALGHGCKWNGTIDELRIYDTPLDITAISGSNTVTVSANDTAGNMNSSTGNFMVYGLNVSVTMPTTGLATTTSLVVDAHVNKVINWMSYSLNAAANVSMAPHNIWNFDEGTGVSVADFSGNNNNLALSSPYTWVSGKSGNAIGVSGHGPVVEKSIAPFDSNTATISFWFKAKPGMTAGTLVSTANSTSTLVNNDQINIGLLNGKAFARVSTGGTNKFTLQSPVTLNDDSWHHLAFVLNNTDTTTARLYIDGADVANTPSAFSMTNQVELRLSCGEALGNGCNWNGTIDELRIYDTPLGITAISGSNTVTVYASDTIGDTNSSTNSFTV